jgi:hypothetical protein
MTDEELVVEKARGRMVAAISVLGVTLYTAYFLTTLIAVRSVSGSGNVRLLTTIQEHKVAFILAGLFISIGVLLSGGVLTHILVSARSRSALVPKLAIYLAMAGPASYAIVYPIFTLALAAASKKFIDSPTHTVELADHLVQSGTVKFAATLEAFSRLLVAVAWVMTGIYGMRNGLLTRLIGLVAVAIGAIFLFAPAFSAFIQIFWIGAVAILLLGESEHVPPAWKLGRTVSWREVADGAHAPVENPSDFPKSDQ